MSPAAVRVEIFSHCHRGETEERDSRRILYGHLYLSLIPDTSIRLFIASASNLEVGGGRERGDDRLKYFWD